MELSRTSEKRKIKRNMNQDSFKKKANKEEAAERTEKMQ